MPREHFPHRNRRIDALLAIPAILWAITFATPTLSTAQDTLWQTWRSGGIQAMEEGRWADAERLLTAALEQAEKYGINDLRVADAANDLAVVYATTGKSVEAELLFRRALLIGERSLGPDHAAIGSTIQNLGILYATQRKYAEAEPLLKRALEINVKRYGINHTRTALTLKTLSSFYAIQGHLSQAEELIQKSLTILEKSRVRQSDPQMTSTLEVFAAILRNTNREQEALEIEQRINIAREETIFR